MSEISWKIIAGDCRTELQKLPAQSIHTCVTSPPYFGLRDYGTGEWTGGDRSCDHTEEIRLGSYNQGFNERWGNASGNRKQEERGKRPYRDMCRRCGATRVDRQIGLEPTPDEFVEALVEVFREVRRVLRDDGTVWLNLGDSYAGGGRGGHEGGNLVGTRPQGEGNVYPRSFKGVKPKDLIGIPWMVAFALRADGWYLRSDIIWAKPNPMPESVTDRPTKAHEYVFLLSKSPRYYYDADAIREDNAGVAGGRQRAALNGDQRYADGFKVDAMRHGDATLQTTPHTGKRNKRSVWTVATQPFSAKSLGISRRVPVAGDDAGDDTRRIASPDCPVHAGRPAPAPTVRRDGRAGPHSRRSPDTPDLAQGLLLDCAPIDRQLGPGSQADSSGSPVLAPPAVATARSSQSHRTDPAPATTPPCTPSAETASRTPGTSDRRGSSEQHPDTPARNSGEDDSAGPPASETRDGTARRPSLSAGSACTCEFYREEEIDHFATFPPDLIEPCVLAGCPAGGTVLDPFAGAGTTGLVATRHNRSFVGIELNPEYAELARWRIRDDAPLFNAQLEAA